MQMTEQSPTNAESLDQAAEQALSWSKDYFEAFEQRLVRRANWAVTYELESLERKSYLKILPRNQAAQVAAMQLLADTFPDVVPGVIAGDSSRGWIIWSDHGGTPLDIHDVGEDAVPRLYGRLQALAALETGLLSALRPIEAEHVVDEFLHFLERPASATGAGFYLGDDKAARYARLFRDRRLAITTETDKVSALPRTVCHGDLHVGNVAQSPDGDPIIFDWDEVAAGYAGMDLHGLLSGSTKACLLLNMMRRQLATPDIPEARVLNSYLEALSESGYATRESLLDGLLGSMCLGQMRFVASFGRYPGEDQRAACARTISERLDDLLDICDWLASRTEADALDSSLGYEHCGEIERARRLVQDQLAKNPQRIDLLSTYGRLSALLKDFDNARQAWTEVLEHQPDWVEVRHHLGDVLCRSGKFQECIDCLKPIVEGATPHPQAVEQSQRARYWLGVEAAAAQPSGIPVIDLLDEERLTGVLRDDTLLMIEKTFLQYGVAQINNVFTADHVQSLGESFMRKRAEELEDKALAQVLAVGDKRYMLTMSLDDEFGDPGLVASSLYLPVMRRLLGPDCILSAYTAVVSLPGSENQWPHKDHSALFEEAGWAMQMPTFAAQIILPLRPLNGENGTTRVYKGSQRITIDTALKTLGYQEPEVPLGSCILLDYATLHHGLGNRSSQPRPIVNLIYSRPWFRDFKNYRLQPPLRFSKDYFATATPEVRKLVSWWDIERRIARQD